ncbi:DUF883 domain-containing protein [Glaciimonas sp. CA11.2]|uniref:DUF883 family protein n=1 Tax=unclassified Glaciimonas TaxID=2644401 RepID=UPI002AB4E5EF|nr:MULTISPECIES: DUF883 domain-containing protein [unclassified Glaciimonas]MDY7547300.1 DUF883 domain-containing protein [Glaciimonas sp. CA11.2]MEB0012668.1 DUF883 domain-containing protein [Glaciimonas sp. Cout2]MEB0082991.1 DUF883 domain-containing protein [Glaciimonas sp. Gout2]MEB0163029.1 DUF883 domain-containing protein [Glaciimonas sp. CA11.2]
MRNNSLENIEQDMQSLVREALKTLREASFETGEKATNLINKGIGLLDDTLAKAQQVQSAAIDGGRAAITSTDEYVHENPWRVIAISLAVGVLAGVCVSRK